MRAGLVTALGHFSWYSEGELDRSSAPPSSSHSVSQVSQGSKFTSSHEFSSRQLGREPAPLQAWAHVVHHSSSHSATRPGNSISGESASEVEEERAGAPGHGSAGEPDSPGEPGLEELPSVGSRRHGEGTCTPCVFEHAKVTTAGFGCKQGRSCEFCHLSHTRRTPNRRSKVKRGRYKKLLAGIETALDAEPDALMDAVASLPPALERQQALTDRLVARFQGNAGEGGRQRPLTQGHGGSGEPAQTQQRQQQQQQVDALDAQPCNSGGTVAFAPSHFLRAAATGGRTPRRGLLSL